jgi:hypothetical protein
MTAKEFYDFVDPICAAGLRDSLNPKTHVYDLQLMDKAWHQTYEFYPTEDLTSTAICLIGISRGQVDPASVNLDPQQTLEAMYALSKKRAYPGGFGLVLWANSVWNGPELAKLEELCGVKLDPIAQHVTALTTMETSWLASGLAHEYSRSGNSRVKELLDATVDELMNRRYQSSSQTVAHAGEAAEFGHGMRRWIANFADQVYTIQALAFYKIVGGNSEALNISDTLAKKMVAFQGSKGQWWWHYDARRGGVPQPYSVYSVHQHGMAPMALRAVEAAGGSNFEDAVALSRSWMDDNELGVNMIDMQQPSLWRSLDYDQGKIGDVMRKASSLLGLAGDRSSAPAPALKLNYETRPYEWAWCVYAGAIERGIDKGLHLV